MRETLALARRYAPWPDPLFLSGERGVGKTTLAANVHRLAFGQSRPFVEFSCATTRVELLSSAIFGYVRGAFTGAEKDTPGLIDAAEGGTLFLDEIHHLPPAGWKMLLQFVESGEFRPVGTTKPRLAAVRLIVATNRDLREEVRRGTIDADFVDRLEVLRLHVPALRERREEISLLTQRFLDATNREGLRLGRWDERREFSPAAETLLLRHDWPGNIRELKNAIRRLAISSLQSVITEADVARDLASGSTTSPARFDAEPAQIPSGFCLDDHLHSERERWISLALKLAGGNQRQAAAMLGVPAHRIKDWRTRKEKRPVAQGVL